MTRPRRHRRNSDRWKLNLFVRDGRILAVELYRKTSRGPWRMKPPRLATLPEIVAAAEEAGEDVGPMLARLGLQDTAWHDDRQPHASRVLAALNMPRKGNNFPAHRRTEKPTH